jgi:hypothetical protein
MTAFKSLRRRSAKARGKAIFAGLLYLLGTIGLAVVAFMPLTVDVEVGTYGALTVSNFWMPIADLFANLDSFADNATNYVVWAFSGLLFGLMILFTVINALRSISKLDRLCSHGSRRVGFNQNKIAVDSMAKIFSCSYSLVAVHTLLIMALNPSENGAFSLIFMITTIVFLAIHFITGPIVGSISTFTVRDFVAERPRTHGGFAPFLRNLFQFAAIGGIFFFAIQLLETNPQVNGLWSLFDSLCNMPATIEALGTGKIEEIFKYSARLVWGIGFICLLCFLRHAVNFTEYYAYGEKAKGRKAARVASFFLFFCMFLLWCYPVIEHSVLVSEFPTWNSILETMFVESELIFFYATMVALGMFIIECLMAKFPKMKKKYRDMPEVALVYDLPDADGQMMAQQAMQAPIMMQPSANGKNPVMVMMPTNMQGQPVMMVPTPMMQPVAMPTNAAVAPTAPMQAAPVQQMSMQAAPAQAMPVQHAPVHAVPVQQAPVHAMPMQAAPIQHAPMQAVPMQAAPVQHAPMQQMPVQHAPTPMATPVTPVRSAPAATPIYTQPSQPVMYNGVDVSAIKDKWVRKGLEARNNQNK